MWSFYPFNTKVLSIQEGCCCKNEDMRCISDFFSRPIYENSLLKMLELIVGAIGET